MTAPVALPPDGNSSTIKTKANVFCAKSSGYRKIRWRKYEPKKRPPEANGDQFVQWLPPTPTQVDLEQEEKQHSHAPTPKPNGKTPPFSKATMASPLLPLPLNGTRVDPFLHLPIKATYCVRDTMDYFVTICNGLKSDDTSIVPGPVNPHLSLLLPYALHHSILFESIIAVCRASILLSLGRSTFEDLAFIQHRGNAIAGLNRKLQSRECTDDDALLTVTMLMTLEYLIGNQYGVRMHCTGLEKMLQLRGPVSNDKEESDWAKFVGHGLTAYKALGSFVTGQPPDIPADSPGYLKETFEELALDKPLSYPEPPYPPELCTVLSRLPSGLSELCLKSRISVQMINLTASISAATTLLASKGLLDVFMLPSPEQGEQRQQTMIQSLMSSLQRMSLSSTVPVEHSLTLGLLSYVFQLRSLSPLNLFYDPLLRNFISSFPCHSKPSTVEEQNCLIWSSMAAAGALALRVVSMPGSHTVMDHALEIYPDMRSWGKLEKILCGFFWTEDINNHWKTVWEVAMQRREFLLRRNINLQAQHEVAFPESPDPDPAMIRKHIQGAPRAMIEMSQAMGICPFRPRPAKDDEITG
ncbi:hypothetical protein LTR47_001898 [Exophiala xenobiotica]|nr:hypothetical protein LTR47_001898 [Exophiala xenobiotica]KAK5251044.1 hypothetical protein LTS06_004194 [Exophiala xenobiotica]KAK5356279.1 hypothetical protein LTR61_000014 [Exophiala xenobiotica]KAK5370749.1 hypothetical protein LTS03_007113 [Exophiala xenobiotica]KAK5389903.1 hypothetical protein LTR11_000713 [Exophiala xenobiotica]